MVDFWQKWLKYKPYEGPKSYDYVSFDEIYTYDEIVHVPDHVWKWKPKGKEQP